MKSETIETTGKHIALTMVSLMFVTVAMIFYFLFIEEPYLEYRNLPFPPTVEQVHAGEIIPLRVEHCNNSKKNKTYSTTHALQNIRTKEILLLPDVIVRIDPGCADVVSLINKVPLEVLPGRYQIYGTAEIRGVLKDFYVDWHSQEFDVIPQSVKLVPKTEIKKLK